MNRHSKDTTTIDVTTGRKYTVRKKFRPRTFAFTISASTRASPACTGTTTAAKYNVLRSDAQNTGSPNSWTKLSKPTTRAGRREISRALVKASPKANATGTTKKTTRRTTAGEAISIPTTDSPRRARLTWRALAGRAGAISRTAAVRS